MTLADDIRALRSRALADLDAAHEYYTDTKIAWDIVGENIHAGRQFAIRNAATGAVTTQDDLANKADGYVSVQLAGATFQQFIATFENYLLDLLRLWLTAYPQSLASKTIDFKTVLEAPDKDAITDLIVDKELNEILYQRPSAWFAYLENRAKLGCPTPDEIDRITEAKASRDVLAHNRGVANKTYETKAGRLARYKEGQLMDIPEHYHRETWQLLRKVIADISDAAIGKFS
jgi:hypothetical protein